MTCQLHIQQLLHPCPNNQKLGYENALIPQLTKNRRWKRIQFVLAIISIN